jgi:TrmH family RNA methyltransferase
VRAGAGAHFQVGIVAGIGWDAIAAALPVGAPVYVADARAEWAYWHVDWTNPATIVVSSEAHGASDAARLLATGAIGIPMQAGVESLNAGVAGSIILFEALRQRSMKD